MSRAPSGVWKAAGVTLKFREHPVTLTRLEDELALPRNMRCNAWTRPGSASGIDLDPFQILDQVLLVLAA